MHLQSKSTWHWIHHAYRKYEMDLQCNRATTLMTFIWFAFSIHQRFEKTFFSCFGLVDRLVYWLFLLPSGSLTIIKTICTIKGFFYSKHSLNSFLVFFLTILANLHLATNFWHFISTFSCCWICISSILSDMHHAKS